MNFDKMSHPERRKEKKITWFKNLVGGQFNKKMPTDKSLFQNLFKINQIIVQVFFGIMKTIENHDF